MTSAITDSSLGLLQVLRVRGASSAAEIERAAGADTAAVLDALLQVGWISRDGAGRWRLTEAGRTEHDAALTCVRPRLTLVLTPVTARFLAKDEAVKTLCTRWQETDPAQTARRWDVLADLDDLAADVLPALESVAVDLPRFAAYGRRLREAVARARNGDARYVASPLVDSFHSVWFECHEDLILSMGWQRGRPEASVTQR